MFIDLTPEQHALRLKCRDYFQALMTPELKARMRGAEGGDVPRQDPQDGARWLAGHRLAQGVRRPGLSATEQLIFFEANIAGAPLPFVTISTVGPALMEHGTEAQKQEFLPGMASGDIIFAIGYSEPGAGSDLAMLRHRLSCRAIFRPGILWSTARSCGLRASNCRPHVLAGRTYQPGTGSPQGYFHHGGESTRDKGFSHTLIQTVGNYTALFRQR
jgi:hypothetical protein